MNIHIRDTAGLWIDVNLVDNSTGDLIDALEEQLGIPKEYMKLIYRGVILDYNSSLHHYGVKNGSTLVLYHRIQISDDAIETLKAKMTEQIQQIDSSIADYEVDDYAELNAILIQNPLLSNEVSRMTDITISNVERMKGGFNELVKIYNETEEESYDQIQYPTVIPEKGDGPSTEPLPCLFGTIGDYNSFIEEDYEQIYSNDKHSKLKRTESEDHVHAFPILEEHFF